MTVPNQVLAATGNKNKLKELQTVAQEFGCMILSPQQIRDERKLGPWPDVEENAPTFRENALLKAREFHKWSGCPTIGDDSGIEVAALDGRPGIHSARYAGPGASDADRINKLLEELRAAIEADPMLSRAAQFRCALALVIDEVSVVESEGILSGHILDAPRGDKGFGYDPILYLDAIGSTLAEVEFSVTCEKGFRAVAARNLFAKLK
ncbi:MAG: non-canonical purine NTP pyrophosphatase [Bdellovibrionota bacterium]